MASSNASGESRNLVTSFMSCVESLLAEKEKRRDALSSMSTKMLNTLSSYKDMVSNTSFISTLSKRFSSIRQSITGRKKRSNWEHALAQAEFRQKVYQDLDVMDSIDHATLLCGKFFPLVDGKILSKRDSSRPLPFPSLPFPSLLFRKVFALPELDYLSTTRSTVWCALFGCIPASF